MVICHSPGNSGDLLPPGCRLKVGEQFHNLDHNEISRWRGSTDIETDQCFCSRLPAETPPYPPPPLKMGKIVKNDKLRFCVCVLF